MSEKSKNENSKNQTSFSREVGAKADRKLKARRNAKPGVWFGLGMMGLIGWSVVIPTLLGAALGYWLDTRFPESSFWTLILLITGLIVGCLNAWYWVSKEDKEMHEEQEDGQEDIDE